MNWWEAGVLGVVEGLTEYFPVSSTGHLLLTQKLLALPDGPGVRAFEIVIQGGAILAVCGVLWKHVKNIIDGLLGISPSGLHLLLSLFIAFVPAAGLGLLTEKWIDKANLTVTSWAWILGGLAIFWLERKRRATGREIESLSMMDAAIIGLFQCAALCPGVSRSLACLAGGLIIGLHFTAALEFSFLLGALTLTAASGYKAIKYRSEILHEIPPLSIAIGIIMATLAAAITVRWMLSSLGKYGLTPFAWYRIVLGVIVLFVLNRG